VALTDMIKQGYAEEEVEEMRSKLHYEGWKAHKLLPKGWFSKMWEGGTRKSKLVRNLYFVTSEGVRLEGFKSILDFMEFNNVYNEDDMDKIKKYREEESIDVRRKSYDWEEDSETVPVGWKKRPGSGKNETDALLSPEGIQYRSRFNALQNMVKKGYPIEEIDAMKEVMVYEGWGLTELLPDGWLFKKVWDGKDDGRITVIHYISDKGQLYESAKTAIEYLKTTVQSKEKIANLLELQTFLCKVWNEGDETVPAGWKIRKSKEREFLLSPDGKQYISRIVALTDMAKNGCKKEELDEMMDKLKYEGWKTNQYLPTGWLCKLYEASNSKQRLDKKLSIVSREGVRMESFKTVLEYMESTEVYTKDDMDKIREFKREESVDTRRRVYDWEEDRDTLPPGWKKRPTTGKNDAESILSPEGEQYRSRFNAVQNMVKKGCSLDEIDEMKDMLIHEGWESIEFLPDGWLLKRIWEGTDAHGRIVTTIHYMSDEGELFENPKVALEYIKANSVDYTEEQVANFQEFQTILRKTSVLKRDGWLEDETVPTGWKRRVIGASGRESILRPDGKQFMTRCSALQAMMEENHDDEDIQSMRSKLCYEGWNEDNCLPEGWLYKLWEAKVNGKTCRSYRFFSVEGNILESMKTAMEFMKACGTYTRKTIKNCKKFLKKGNRNKNGGKVQWKNDDGEAPFGWKSRVSEGRKFYLMPDGKQFPSLFSAFQHMVKNDFLLSQINVIRSFLKYEGWEFDNNLPRGWQGKDIGSGNYWYIGR